MPRPDDSHGSRWEFFGAKLLNIGHKTKKRVGMGQRGAGPVARDPGHTLLSRRLNQGGAGLEFAAVILRDGA